MNSWSELKKIVQGDEYNEYYIIQNNLFPIKSINLYNFKK